MKKRTSEYLISNKRKSNSKKGWIKRVAALSLTAMFFLQPVGDHLLYAEPVEEQIPSPEAGIVDNTPVSEEEHILNYRDVPGDDHVESVSDHADGYVPALRGTVPASYGAEQFKSYMPELRNQNPFGSCWAHSAMALAEISLRKKGIMTDPDLSEMQLAYFSYYWEEDPLGGTQGDDNVGIMGNSNYLDLGGNLCYAENILASWTGAADDAGELAYPRTKEDRPLSLDPSYAYEDRAHLVNYYEVSIDETQGINSEDMQAAKKLIMENGALGCSFFAQSGISAAVSSAVYDKSRNAYYDPDAHGNSTNHSVTIVGWDDNFSKDNFSIQPKGNGAWLIRNSWTTGSYADNQSYSGYFWMSYYNASLDPVAYAYDFDFGDNFDNNYQYDGSAASSSISFLGSDHISAANVFHTSAGDQGETLKAVSFYTPTTNVNYEVKIYTGLSGDTTDPTSGTLAATQTGATTCAGYYTVMLDTPVPLAEQEYFSVVVNLRKTGAATVSIGIETSSVSNWYKNIASAKKGQSYLFNGVSWKDVVSDYHANFRIKAFTDNKEAAPLDLSSATVSVSDTTYSGSALKPPVVVKNNSGGVMSESEYTLSYSDNVNAGTGKVTITAKSGSKKCKGTSTKSFTIHPARLSSATRYYITKKDAEENPNMCIQCPSVYTLWEISRHYRLRLNGKLLVEGKDYEEVDPKGETFLDVTDTYFTLVGKGNFEGTIKIPVVITPTSVTQNAYYVSAFSDKKYYLGAEIAAITDQVYNPHGIEPALTVTNTTRHALTKDMDYTVEYSGNTSVTAGATATAAITGIGNYTGTKSEHFSITAADLSSAELAGIVDQDYAGGTPVTLPNLKVLYDGVELTKDADYSVAYSNNTAAGTASVTITGKGNYTGTKMASFRVVDEARTDLTDADVTLESSSVPYDGTPKEFAVSVNHGGTPLTEGIDYSCSVVFPNGDNTNVGTGTVTVVGNGSYKGTVTKSVTITPANMTSLTVGGIENKTYNKMAQEQSGLTFALGGKTLPTKDFSLVYSNNTNAGTATITISNNNFSNTKTVTFTIGQADLSGADVTPDQNEYVYSRSPVTPGVTVTLDGYGTLTAADYTVSYSNNTNAGDATVTVTGKGNYKNSANAVFYITRKPISVSGVTMTAGSYTYTGTEHKPTVSVKDGSTTLVEDKDYKLLFTNTVDAGRVSVSVEGIGNYSGTTTRQYSIAPAPVTVKADDKTKGYGSDDPTLTATVTGMVNDEPESLIQYTLGRQSGENIGTYTITPTGMAEQGNYAVSYRTGTLKISKGDYDGTKVVAFTVKSDTEKTGCTGQLPALPDGASYSTPVITNDAAGLIVNTTSDKPVVVNQNLVYSVTAKASGTTAALSIPVINAANYNDYAVTVTVTATPNGGSDTPGPAETVEAPTASVEPGSYSAVQTVTLSTATSGAEIRYTTDGSEPTAASTLYNNAITVDRSMTIKAIAVKGEAVSTVAQFAYMLQTQIPTAAPAPGTYNEAKNVALSTATTGAEIYYTIDGTAPTTNSTKYTEAITVAPKEGEEKATVRIRAIALKTGWESSQEFDGTYVIETKKEVIAATGITLDKETLPMEVGDGVQLTAQITPENATDQTVTWVSGDTSVVSVQGNGKIAVLKALSVGSARVTAYAGEVYASALVTVTKKKASENDDDLIRDTQDGTKLKEVESVVVQTEVAEDGSMETTTKIWIGGVKSSYTYTGAAIKPEIHVYDGLSKLTEKTDYSLSYSNNKNVGQETGKITVRFKGNYQATTPETVSFTIAPADFSDPAVIIAEDMTVAVKSGNKEQSPIPTVIFAGSGKAVPKNSYSVTYQREGSTTALDSVTESGKYVAVIAGKAPNFTGTAHANVTVLDAEGKNRSLSSAKILIAQNAKTKLWTGSEVVQDAKDITVKDAAGNEIPANKYTITYADNINPGKATMIVTASDDSANGYVGSKTANFTIKKGKGDSSLTVTMDETAAFEEGGVKPDVIVTDEINGQKVKLREGKDYTVKYSNNTAATVSVKDKVVAPVTDKEKTAVATIKGKGNYSFTVTKNFAILPRNLSGLTLTVEDKVMSKSATAYRNPKFSLTDENGKTIPSSRVEINNYFVNGKRVTEAPAVGTEITLKVVASEKTKNYYGSVQGVYRMITKEQNIAGTKLARKLPAMDYTGSAVTLRESDLNDLLYFGKDKTKTLTAGKDFRIAGYQKNMKKGTAKVILAGIASTNTDGTVTGYGGQKTVTFTITQKKGDYQGAYVNGEWIK